MKILQVLCGAALLMRLACATVFAADFDGRPQNVSTGNLSVNFIQASPIGAHPRLDALEDPPSHEALLKMKQQGLAAYEDYVAWGAIERQPGKWDWTQHDRMCEAVKKAGLKYVVYNWVHFPPTWLRDSPNATLMRCAEHNQSTLYLSIFDPKTLAHYDHLYAELARHFGKRLDAVYACINGPYGEGNYPLSASDWVVNLGHCHEGYWCADAYALASFQRAMRQKYRSVRALNRAWGTALPGFGAVSLPQEIREGRKIGLELWQTAPDRQRWLDFITWYHAAMVNFAQKSVQVVLKYFPPEKVRTKPGGTAGGVNPLAWGTYCPAYAKMTAPYNIVLQPADCHGAYFGDKWLSTAYHFYGVKLATEPAGGADKATFVRRLFSDASCGAAQLFTYEFEQHVPEIQQYAHFLTGKQGDTEIAVLFPTTVYRLGGDVWPSIREAMRLRDLCDYDVLDELLITDGALHQRAVKKYGALIVLQPDWIEQPILQRIENWVRQGGTLLIAGDQPVKNIEGKIWPLSRQTGHTPQHFGRGMAVRFPALTQNNWREALRLHLNTSRGYDGALDGLWTTQRGVQTLRFNTTDQMQKVALKDGKMLEIAPHAIVEAP